MSKQTSRYRTQWTAQFYVAAELTRRGYLVSLTFGNAPESDLLVRSPGGIHFSIDVKGQSTRNFWLLQRRDPKPHNYFILVFLPESPETAPQYSILSSAELMRRREEYRRSVVCRRKCRDELGGIKWSTALAYKDRWGSLPK